MFKTPKHIQQADNFVRARWYHSLHQGAKLNAHDKLWPSSEDFFHPWNPAFSDFCQTQDELDLYPMLLLRDGAQSLLDFFFRFPEPSKTSSDLIVHADLSFLVPESWQEKTKCYRMMTHRSSKPTSRLVFYYLLHEMPLDRHSLILRLQNYLSQFSRESDVSICMGLREALYPKAWNERRDFLDIITELQFYFKNKIKVIELDELKRMGTENSVTFVNLDINKSSIAFCSIDSHMMGNSCQIFPQLADKRFCGEIIERSPLSFNHDLVLYSLQNSKSEFSFLHKLKKSTKNQGEMPFPVLPALMDILVERLSI